VSDVTQEPADRKRKPYKRVTRRKPGSFQYTYEGVTESCTNQRGAVVYAMHLIEVERRRTPRQWIWLRTSEIIEKVEGSDRRQVSARLKSAREYGLVRRMEDPIRHALTPKGRYVADQAARASASAAEISE
jgi:hypothetical protein